MSNRDSKFVKNIGVFALGNFTIKFTQFVMISLCTYTLATSEYGTADAIIQAASLMIPIVGFGINEAFFRFPIDDVEHRDHIFSNCMASLIASIGIVIIVSVVMSTLSIVSKEVILYTGLLVVFEMSGTCFKQFVRGSGDNRSYIIGGFINCILQICAYLIFVVIAQMGYGGYLISIVIAYMVEISYYLFMAKLLRLFCIQLVSLHGIRKYIKYSLPLAPNTIMWWFSNASGRYFLIYFFNTAISGVYAAATKIPALITFFTGFVVDAWKISAVAEYNLEDEEKKDSYAFQSHIFEVLYIAAMSLSMVLMILIRPILSILVSSAYFEAWKCAVILLVGIVFYCLQQFLGSYYAVSKKSVGSLASTTVGALVNVALNLILIPQFGMMGTAIATSTSYIIILIYRYYDTKKYVTISVDWKLFTSMVICMMTVACFIYLDSAICTGVAIIALLISVIMNRKLWQSLFKSALSLVRKTKGGAVE